MLGHITFSAVVVSCGTCNEALHKVGCEEIFECQLQDISSFLLNSCKWRDEEKQSQPVLYHTPCHDSMKGRGVASLRRLYNNVLPIANCCSEAGTLALSRPDIANAMRLRKREQLEKGLEQLAANGNADGAEPFIATNCPSCLTGLGRNRDLGVKPIHIAVLLANRLSADGSWQEELKTIAKGAERVVF